MRTMRLQTSSARTNREPSPRSQAECTGRPGEDYPLIPAPANLMSAMVSPLVSVWVAVFNITACKPFGVTSWKAPASRVTISLNVTCKVRTIDRCGVPSSTIKLVMVGGIGVNHTSVTACDVMSCPALFMNWAII